MVKKLGSTRGDNKKELAIKKLKRELDEAEASIKRGKYYTQEEVMKELELQ